MFHPQIDCVVKLTSASAITYFPCLMGSVFLYQ